MTYNITNKNLLSLSLSLADEDEYEDDEIQKRHIRIIGTLIFVGAEQLHYEHSERRQARRTYLFVMIYFLIHVWVLPGKHSTQDRITVHLSQLWALMCQHFITFFHMVSQLFGTPHPSPWWYSNYCCPSCSSTFPGCCWCTGPCSSLAQLNRVRRQPHANYIVRATSVIFGASHGPSAPWNIEKWTSYMSREHAWCMKHALVDFDQVSISESKFRVAHVPWLIVRGCRSCHLEHDLKLERGGDPPSRLWFGKGCVWHAELEIAYVWQRLLGK